jgi:hypothetical protein
VVSYMGASGPAVAFSPASRRSGESATELTSGRSYTTNGDATAYRRVSSSAGRGSKRTAAARAYESQRQVTR